MDDRELMQQALEALELLARYENPLTRLQVRKPRSGGPIVTIYPHKVATDAAAPLRERLAQPEQEPVAWQWHQAPTKTEWGEDMVVASVSIDKDHTVDLYCERSQTDQVEAMFTPPRREWVGLTEAEHTQIAIDSGCASADWVFYGAAVERKLQEKNA